jgi:4-hydroxy-tetrahydrodipicolinate reductase
MLRSKRSFSERTVRVAVAGALGRMGSVACHAISAAPDLELVGGFARNAVDGDPTIVTSIDEFFDLKPDVIVDFTLTPISETIAFAALERGVSPVVGATGWPAETVDAFGVAAERAGVGAAIVPNFALGAVLMMKFAGEAARHFPSVEIIELHHDGKVDRPSGTARLTASRIEAQSHHANVPIHSVRLRGLVAHQEVLLGGDGEVLTIRHDSLSRESFMAGMLLAIRGVREKRGLTIGLVSFLAEGQS